jgi:hypothetical protein
LQHFEDTADFIKLITTWWSIINVKTPLKGQRLKDVFSEPITQNSQHIFEFLNAFIAWLNQWNSMKGSIGKLTKEKHLLYYKLLVDFLGWQNIAWKKRI